jgi:hypothetical protein
MHFLRTWANLHVDLVSSSQSEGQPTTEIAGICMGNIRGETSGSPHENPGFTEPNASV